MITASLMSFADGLASALSSTSVFHPTALHYIALISLQRSSRSSPKSGTGMGRRLGITAPEVFQLHPPHVRNQSPISHKNQAF